MHAALILSKNLNSVNISFFAHLSTLLHYWIETVFHYQWCSKTSAVNGKCKYGSDHPRLALACKSHTWIMAALIRCLRWSLEVPQPVAHSIHWPEAQPPFVMIDFAALCCSGASRQCCQKTAPRFPNSSAILISQCLIFSLHYDCRRHCSLWSCPPFLMTTAPTGLTYIKHCAIRFCTRASITLIVPAQLFQHC